MLFLCWGLPSRPASRVLLDACLIFIDRRDDLPSFFVSFYLGTSLRATLICVGTRRVPSHDEMRILARLRLQLATLQGIGEVDVRATKHMSRKASMPSRASLADTSEVQDIFCRRAHGLARANSQKGGVGLIETSPARRSGIQSKGGLGLS